MSVNGPEFLRARTPSRIGRYEVIRKIAVGGMAELFLARFVGPGGFEKRCAVKRILPQFAADETFTKMFQTEARIAALLDHPNIVQVFELGEDDGQYFIAMELVNGMNLRQLNQLAQERERVIPPELAAHMMEQVLDGLAHAHEFRDAEGRPLHLVHRDVSPQNLLVSNEGAVKLVDFGIVKGAMITSDTQAGMLKGKIAYMSPEQAVGEQLDHRSDLFSIGICLYELIGGQRPFTGNNEIMYLRSILQCDPPPLSSLQPNIPEGLEQVVYKALAKNKDERYQSARAFQNDLHAVLRQCPIPLGRHVVSDFIKSLASDETPVFDASSLRIPRTPGVEVRYESVAFTSARAEILLAEQQATVSENTPEDPIVLPVDFTENSVVQGTPTPGMNSRISPLIPLEASNFLQRSLEQSGLSGVWGPMIAVVFLASALLGGFAVFLVTRKPTIVIEASPVAMRESELVAAETFDDEEDSDLEVEHEEVARSDVDVTVKEDTRRKSKTIRGERDRTERAEKKRERQLNGGTLSLKTVPSNLAVYLGKELLGRTPLSDVPMPPGDQTIRIKGKELGIRKRMALDIDKGSHLDESVVFELGTLKVISRPWSEVFINGVSRGKTPLEIALYEGTHEVRLVSPEAGERIQKVEVKAEETNEVKVKF